ncbi:MAG: ribonuclease Z [Thermoplasmata archaeon]|nr:ribonuclease Z [Thermoplasmata archaeon]
MEVIFLGTGGTVPTPERNTVAVAVRVDNEVVLFDCCEGCQKQIMRSTVSFMKIKKVFITHFHGDHFLGLPGMLQTMGLLGRTAPLEIYGPEGAEGFIENLLETGYYGLDFDVRARDLKPGNTVQEAKFTVEAISLNHLVPTNGYLLREKTRPGRFYPEKAEELGVPKRFYGKLQRGECMKVGEREITPDMVMGPPRRGISVAYCTDTTPDWDTGAAKDCSLLIHDATGCDALKEKLNTFGHSTARQAAEIAKKCNAGKLALIHYSQRYREVSGLLEEARVIFQNTFAPRDLDTVMLKHED